MGDFNGDGNADLAAANADNNTVSVLLGNGDGTLQAAKGYDAGGSAAAIAIGDFNGDGKVDLAVGSNYHNVNVLLGNGDGSFQAARTFDSGGDTPLSLAVGDFNGDGKSDLAVASLFNGGGTGSLSVLLGNGDGTFQTALTYPLGTYPGSIAVGDFNGDHKLDVALGNTLLLPGTISVLLGNGDGSFQAPENFDAGGDAEALAVADFNGDGTLDLATVNDYNNSSDGQSQAGVLIGNGDGTFQPAQDFPLGTHRSHEGDEGYPAFIKVGDLNGDGKPDLAIANEHANTTGVSLLLGNGDGTFQTPQVLATAYPTSSVALGDFNGDGKPDLAVTSPFYAPPGVGVLLNQLVTTTTVSGTATSTYGQSVTFSASVMSGGGPRSSGTVTFLFQPDYGVLVSSPAMAVDANGMASFSIATLDAHNYTVTAMYNGTPAGAGVTGFGTSTADATALVVNPVVLSATAANVSAAAQSLFNGTVATFTNADPFGSAASYSATIDWGDGTVSDGTITGTGTLAVTGSHTYINSGTYTFSVEISHNLGDTTTATASAIADVLTMAHDIGFWRHKPGQTLIRAFNGGSKATALATWLATSFPNLYGARAGVNNLTGDRNSQVAAFYKAQAALPGSNVEAEVLATALNVYATTQSLGGTIGQSYGFTVSAAGLGAASFNIGADGAAFGVPKKTTLSVYALLQAANRQTVVGVLYNGDPTLQKLANHLFHAINEAGSIT